MPLPTLQHPLSKAVVATVAVPMYIIGAVSWIIITYGMLSDATSPLQWPTRDIVVGFLLCFALFPLAIVLICTIAAAYFPWRVALTLLIPVPAMNVGIVFTPGNGAPFHLVGSALASLFLMVILLQYWAHRAPTQRSEHYVA